MKIAAVQACPVYMDRDATVAKACDLIARVGAAGGSLAVFPEAFVPGYPVWSWFVPAAETRVMRAMYAELVANAVTVPSEATDRLCEAAKNAGVAVAIGINELNAEASGTTVYNALLFIGANGAILGKHRKLIPTGGERLVWAWGDGSDLAVYPMAFGRVSGLICWENYMPLARYALAAWGAEIHVAPTWDRGEPWLSTLRHSAKEMRCYVVGCCSAMRKDDVPDRFAFKQEYLGGVGEWINPGDSAIVNPDGKIVAGPAREQETILYADVHRTMISGPRSQLDVAGHYARPDVFELIVHRKPKPMIAKEPEVKQSVPFFMVTNIEASIRFYVDGLGFETRHRWIPDGTLQWCWLQQGGAALMLQEIRKVAKDGDPPFVTTGKLGEGVSICFMCDDALAMYHRAVEHGLKVKRPFVGNGLWVTSLADPDGYRIDFESPADAPEETEYGDGAA